MPTNTDHQTAARDLALYAIDAIEAGERVAVDEHLAHCTGCREEVARLRDAASLLAPVTRRDLDRCWDAIVLRLRRAEGISPTPTA
jgi:hypothetical protein